jgi:hypothetical protein
MMIFSPALEKIVTKFLPGETKNKRNSLGRVLRKKLLKLASEIGYMRLCAEMESLPLGFRNISFQKFTNFVKLEIDMNMLITEAKSNSVHCQLSDAEIIVKVNNMKNNSHDPWLISHGKDMLNLLVLLLPQEIGRFLQGSVSIKLVHMITYATISNLLYTAYETAYFQDTTLYKELKLWETRHTPYKILRF